MKFIYKPKNNLEKFGVKVYPFTKSSNKAGDGELGIFFKDHKTSKLLKFGVRVYSALVENFSQTFFVGGMVRDLIIRKIITDVDIATSATPEQIIGALKKRGIGYIDSHKKFGNIVAKQGSLEVEITTFRKDLSGENRYHKIQFIKTPKADSQRRDFTVNSLYLSLKQANILDFQKGLADLKNHQLKFIGNPKKRISQDPLRIIRALRFALILNFKLEKNAKQAIKTNLFLIKELTKTKINKEINKINSPAKRKILKKVINKPKLLDKYF